MSQKELTYSLNVSGLDSIEVFGETTILVKSGEVVTVPVRLRVDPVYLKKASSTIHFKAEAIGEPEIFDVGESRFLGPVSR